MMKDKVAILLSTFNGEHYLNEQIDSILNQTHREFIIYIRDDGSTDNTRRIIDQYSIETDCIVLVNDSLCNIGVAKSYELLMKQSQADFYLFADQDDIWEPTKLEVLFSQAKKFISKNEPYLLFSNMIIFNEATAAEYDFFEKFKVNETKVKNGLFQGTISGCLMLFNNKAKQQSLKMNAESNMLHDWNMFISTFLLGTIELVNDPLIKHRIHRNNAIGESAKRRSIILIKDLVKYFFKSTAYREIVLKEYFTYVDNVMTYLPKELRLKKELFNHNELKNLSYLNRKKWYLKHFNPFIYGPFKGLLITMTV